jgi:hypothetical protein
LGSPGLHCYNPPPARAFQKRAGVLMILGIHPDA